MNTNSTGQVIVIGAVVTIYIVWLIVFLLVIERWLRHLTEWLFGVTIKRDFFRPAGKVELLDGLFMFSWTVVEPASLSVRFAIGLLRISFWLVAMVLPIIFGVVLYFRLQTFTK